MKKEFIMPSLEMKKFSKVLVMDASQPGVPEEPTNNLDKTRAAVTADYTTEIKITL